MPYETYLENLAPPWLRDIGGKAMTRSMGRLLDRGQAQANEGTRLRMPEEAAGLLAVDALLAIGQDRSIPPGPVDLKRAWALVANAEAYALRLREAWTTWGRAGTHEGLLRMLEAVGFRLDIEVAPEHDTAIVQYGGRYAQLDGDVLELGHLSDCENRPNLAGSLDPQPGWMFDEAADTHWSSFGILWPYVGPGVYWPQPNPAGWVALSNAAGNQPKALLNAIVKLWKPAKAVYRGAWLLNSYATDGGCLGWPPIELDGTQVLGGADVLGGDLVTFIDPE